MKIYYKLLIGAVIGGVLGFAYYYFIGCSSGTCPITSNWKISTLYGIFSGVVIAYPGKKKKIDDKN